MEDTLDWIDEQENVLGAFSAEEIHKKALLHSSVHVFIIDSNGLLFCRKIISNSRIYPGYWSTTVGAHVFSGKDADKSACESVKHNIGIDCELKMIGKVRVQDRFENEISSTYIGYADGPLRIKSGEIEEGRFMAVEEIRRLVDQEHVTPHLILSLDQYIGKNRLPISP